jgi:hypothetical protein
MTRALLALAIAFVRLLPKFYQTIIDLHLQINKSGLLEKKILIGITFLMCGSISRKKSSVRDCAFLSNLRVQKPSKWKKMWKGRKLQVATKHRQNDHWKLSHFAIEKPFIPIWKPFKNTTNEPWQFNESICPGHFLNCRLVHVRWCKTAKMTMTMNPDNGLCVPANLNNSVWVLDCSWIDELGISRGVRDLRESVIISHNGDSFQGTRYNGL